MENLDAILDAIAGGEAEGNNVVGFGFLSALRISESRALV
jgi:hypothetical protein